MNDQPRSLAGVEGSLFGAICGFHEKVIALVRQSSLDDAQRAVVADRIKTMVDDVTAEMKQSKRLNVADRLDAAFEDIQRLVRELLVAREGGQDKPAEATPGRLKGRKNRR